MNTTIERLHPTKKFYWIKKPPVIGNSEREQQWPVASEIEKTKPEELFNNKKISIWEQMYGRV